MFGMPCLKRENGKVVAGHWKDGGITVKLTDEAQREAALALPGAGRSTPAWAGSCASGFSSRRRSPASGSVSSSRRSADRRADRLAPGEGEVLSDAPRPSRIKAARDELLLLEVSSPPESRGAAPHVHREHADAFYVLEGELLSHVAGGQHRLPAGSFVLAPPGLVHGFEVGPEGARYLNLHMPGAAYAKLARARRDGVELDPADGDSFPPPDDGGLPAAEALLHHAGEGEQGGSIVKAARPELSLLVFEVRARKRRRSPLPQGAQRLVLHPRGRGRDPRRATK